MLHRYWLHLRDEMSDTGRQTFRWDLLRGAASGGVNTVQMTFALLVAITVFDAGTTAKSLIAGAHAIGLLLSLPYAAWSPVLAGKTVRAALPAFGSALGLVVAAMARDTATYTCGIVVFGTCSALALPVMTGVYRDNYRGTVRGQVFGITVLTAVIVGLVTQFLGGAALDADLGLFRVLFLALAAMAFVMGFAIFMIPHRGERDAVSPNPLASFGAVRDNPMFGYVLVAWFLFGFANLMLMPQRIEYLSRPEYGLGLSPGAVVLIVGVTTEVARLCTIPVWARLFDRYQFIWLRIGICGFLLVYILLYFHTQSLPLLVLASACLGTSFGGGSIAWSLWVTKFAPPAETARYMSVHTFMTGIRGSCSPLVGYLCVEAFTIQTTAWLSAGLVTVSIVMLWRIRNRPTRTETAQA